MSSPLEIAKVVFDVEIGELKSVASRLNDSFNMAINTILKSSGKVVLTGVGKSGLIAKKIAATLSSTGTTAIFMHSTEGLHGDLGMITAKDTVIAISNSGRSDEILAIMPSIESIGAKIIVMTGDTTSPLAEFSKIVLDIGVEKEACPMNLAPTSSTTTTLVMGDAIAAALVTLRNFKPENFGVYHPGGSLGRRLLTRVKDIMQSIGKLAIAESTTPIDEILLSMTEKQLGAVCIVEGDLNLLGIITEGDIRRALIKKETFFKLSAQDIMTQKPIVISPEDMAVDALAIMEERSSQISILPVTNREKLIGLVRIHDLLMVKE